MLKISVKSLAWLIIAATLLASLNSFTVKWSAIGFVSFAVFMIAGTALLSNLFGHYGLLTKMIGDSLLLFMLIGLVSSIFAILHKLGGVEAASSLAIISLFLIVFSIGHRNSHMLRWKTCIGSLLQSKRNRLFSTILAMLFLTTVTALLYLSLTMKQPVIANVRVKFNPFYFLLYFVSSASLLSLIFLHYRSNLNLFFIMMLSLVSCCIIPSVYVFGLGFPYGTDECIHLGYAHRLYEGSLDVWGRPLVFSINFPHETLPLKIYCCCRNIFHYASTVTLARILCTDIFWVHSLFTPLLWSFMVPTLSYGIAKALNLEHRYALLAAFLTIAPSTFMGGRSVPNSLGLILFCYTVYVLTMYSSVNGRYDLLNACVGALCCFLTEYFVGVLSFSAVLLAIFLKKSSYIKRSIAKALLYFSGVVACAMLLPLALYLHKYVYLFGSSFSLERLQTLSIYELVFRLFLGAFSSMTLGDALVQGTLLLLGFVSSIRILVGNDDECRLKTRFLATSFIVLWLSYLILENAMIDVPFSPTRLWIPLYFIATPLTAIMFHTMIQRIRGRNGILVNTSSHPLRFSACISRSSVAILTLVFLLSAITVGNHYYTYCYGYPSRNFLLVSVYDGEAVRFIDAITNRSYVVICDRAFAEVGMSLNGFMTSRGCYTPYWDGNLRSLYTLMYNEPNIAILENALEYSQAQVAYFVINKLRMAESDFRLTRILASQILTPVNISFGNGNIAIFKWDKWEKISPMPQSFFDDFSSPSLEWIKISGTWRVSDGTLIGGEQGKYGEGIILAPVYNHNFTANFKVRPLGGDSSVLNYVSLIYSWKNQKNYQTVTFLFSSSGFIHVHFTETRDGVVNDLPKWPGVNTGLKWEFGHKYNITIAVDNTSTDVSIDSKKCLSLNLEDIGGIIGLQYSRFFAVSFDDFAIKGGEID